MIGMFHKGSEMRKESEKESQFIKFSNVSDHLFIVKGSNTGIKFVSYR